MRAYTGHEVQNILSLPSLSKLHLCRVVRGIEGMIAEEEAAAPVTVKGATGIE
jgi:hypothetical protein